MRNGLNPMKAAVITPLAEVVVLVITYLPEMESEYHRTRLDVIKRSLTTLINNINIDTYDLIVWDNCSCRELGDWLAMLGAGLILTRNIGKTNALKSVMRMLPPGSILAYSDDDMEYAPNWLQPQIEILKTYPNVGTVTGWPVRITSKWGEECTLKWAKENAQVEADIFIPAEWERDYCASVGRTYDNYCTATAALKDYRITYKGVQAYAMSQHCQFVCYPERVEPFVEWSKYAMPQERKFDLRVAEAGLLRLATVDRYTRHIGNVLD